MSVKEGPLPIHHPIPRAYLSDYQTVTSHGNETVPDEQIVTHVAHLPGVAILSPAGLDKHNVDHNKGRVHTPIHNPPLIVGEWDLRDLYVNFESIKDATVEDVALYYDGRLVFSAKTHQKKRFHINFEGSKYRYSPPEGISITLTLGFPSRESAIRLYSITLGYHFGSGAKAVCISLVRTSPSMLTFRIGAPAYSRNMKKLLAVESSEYEMCFRCLLLAVGHFFSEDMYPFMLS